MTFLLGIVYFVTFFLWKGSSYSFREALRLPCVFPVLHNVQPAQIPQLIEVIKSQPLSSISLRREFSVASTLALLKAREEKDSNRRYGYVGVSTVAFVSQVSQLKSSGIDFFSTIHYSKPLLDFSIKERIPMFCAVRNVEDCQALVQDILTQPNPHENIIAMKLYPIKDMSKETFLRLISIVEKNLYYQGVPLDIIVSGGVTAETSLEEMTWYLKEGATNLAVGYDCEEHSLAALGNYLKVLNDRLLVAKSFATGERYESMQKTKFQRHINTGASVSVARPYNVASG